MSTAAQSDRLFSRRVVLVAQMVNDGHGSGDQQWAIFSSLNRDFGHESLLDGKCDEWIPTKESSLGILQGHHGKKNGYGK
jgi:hypothetical protein